MARKPLIVANWKMNKTISESVDFVEEFLPLVSGVEDVDVAIAPPATALAALGKALSRSWVALAAQNMHWEGSGAFTGEISPVMLRDIGCRMVIVGHSERRQFFGEGDGEVARKIAAAMREGITPILCVGETLGEREYGKTFDVVERQLLGALDGTVVEGGADLVVAYEPVWAIGTGKTATQGEAQEVHGFIRGLMAGLVGKEVSDQIRVLYGGSVKPDNTSSLITMEDIDGALVGGAGLDPESFAGIVKAAKARE
ncbi:MAG: triose-phosphate isomerase [bacterium]|nr:triose-phosphate isomerase [bacterium]MDT8396801.1 triose-phosphate isomerase [bacterium]